jgi:hypothetical protein
MPTTTSRRRVLTVRVLVFLGLFAMVTGIVVLDPVEGSVVIVPAIGLVALGAHLGRTRFRKLGFWSFALGLIGLTGLWILSALGGTGGDTGVSSWWNLITVPYVVGGVLGFVAAIGTSVAVLHLRPGQPLEDESSRPRHTAVSDHDRPVR